MVYQNVISISTNDAGNDVGEIDPEKEEALAVELNPKWYGCKDDPRGAFDAGHVFYMNLSNPNECNNPYSFDRYKTTVSEIYSCGADESKKFCPKTCYQCEEKWKGEYSGLDVWNVQLPSYRVDENENGYFLPYLSEIRPSESLSVSYLAKLDPVRTKAIDIKKEFCLELKAIATKYSEPERARRYFEEVISFRSLGLVCLLKFNNTNQFFYVFFMNFNISIISGRKKYTVVLYHPTLYRHTSRLSNMLHHISYEVSKRQERICHTAANVDRAASSRSSECSSNHFKLQSSCYCSTFSKGSGRICYRSTRSSKCIAKYFKIRYSCYGSAFILASYWIPSIPSLEPK